MIGLHIDPALIALPNGLAESEDELAALIMRGVSVGAWAKGCNLISIFKTSDFELILEETGNFPSLESIHEALVVFGLEHVFSAKDILLNSLLIMERALISLNEFGSEVTGLSNVCPEVSEIFSRHPLALREACLRSMATLAWLSYAAIVKPTHFLVSGNPEVGTADIAFAGSLDDIICDADCAVPELPLQLAAQLRSIDEADDVIEVVTALDVWRNATTAGELHLAIFTKAIRLAETAGIPRKDLRAFTIGSEFLQSIETNQALAGIYGSTTLETCARIVAGSPKYEINDFGGVRSDGSVGKRTHITKHVSALRLMFWISTSGQIEFANVGPKGQLVIETGVQDQTTEVAYPSKSDDAHA